MYLTDEPTTAILDSPTLRELRDTMLATTTPVKEPAPLRGPALMRAVADAIEAWQRLPEDEQKQAPLSWAQHTWRDRTSSLFAPRLRYAGCIACWAVMLADGFKAMAEMDSRLISVRARELFGINCHMAAELFASTVKHPGAVLRWLAAHPRAMPHDLEVYCGFVAELGRAA